MLVVMPILTEQVIDTEINSIQTKANLENVVHLGCTQHLATFQITIHHFYRLVVERLVLWTQSSLCKDQMERSEWAIKHLHLQNTSLQQQPGECRAPLSASSCHTWHRRVGLDILHPSAFFYYSFHSYKTGDLTQKLPSVAFFSTLQNFTQVSIQTISILKTVFLPRNMPQAPQPHLLTNSYYKTPK